MKFSEYREMRDTLEFDRKFSLLCEGIARSGKTFDSWWSNEGLPIILESNQFSNEDELMLELMGGVGNAMGNMAGRAWQGMKNLGRGAAHGWGAGQQATGQWNPQDPNAQAQQQQAPPLVDPNNPNAQAQQQPTDIPPENFQDPAAAMAQADQGAPMDPAAAMAQADQSAGGGDPAAGGPEAAAQQQAPAMSPEKQQRLDAFQRGIDQSTDTIKQKFQGAMRDFLQGVQQDAVKEGPSGQHMWQIAKNFSKQVMDAAQPAIDSFKQKGQYGTRQQGGYQDQFAAAQGAYQQNQQSDLKSQLQAKHGNKQTAGAPQNLQQPAGQGNPTLAAAKQQFPAGAHMRPGMAVA